MWGFLYGYDRRDMRTAVKVRADAAVMRKSGISCM